MGGNDVLASLTGDYHRDCNALIAEVKRLRGELLNKENPIVGHKTLRGD